MAPTMIKLPVTGWFADGRTFKHKLEPPRSDLKLTTMVRSPVSQEERPFLSHLVEGLASVRDRGMGGGAGTTGAREWLEWHEFIEAVEAKADLMPSWIDDIRYRITERGRGFLATHEAPAEW